MRSEFLASLVACGAFARSLAYRVVIDLNTYTASDVAFAAANFRLNGGAWVLTTNSAKDIDWVPAVKNIGRDVYSEDSAASADECKHVRQLNQGALTASFQYWEVGAEPHTMLTWEEIDKASAACGDCPIVILTRDYQPHLEYRANVEKVLAHPKLKGVAMEYLPWDAGKRGEDDFVNNLLAAGKEPMFLLPFGFGSPKSRPSKSAADTYEDAIATFRSMGADMDDERVVVIPARYDDDFPIFGANDSIAAVVTRLQQLQQASPIGVVETCSTKSVSGWARDPDFHGPIAVHIYLDGPIGRGSLLLEVSAGDSRPDVGEHGFHWEPTTNVAGHEIYMYFIGTDGTGTPDDRNFQQSCIVGKPVVANSVFI